MVLHQLPLASQPALCGGALHPSKLKPLRNSQQPLEVDSQKDDRRGRAAAKKGTWQSGAGKRRAEEAEGSRETGKGKWKAEKNMEGQRSRWKGRGEDKRVERKKNGRRGRELFRGSEVLTLSLWPAFCTEFMCREFSLPGIVYRLPNHPEQEFGLDGYICKWSKNKSKYKTEKFTVEGEKEGRRNRSVCREGSMSSSVHWVGEGHFLIYHVATTLTPTRQKLASGPLGFVQSLRKQPAPSVYSPLRFSLVIVAGSYQTPFPHLCKTAPD